MASLPVKHLYRRARFGSVRTRLGTVIRTLLLSSGVIFAGAPSAVVVNDVECGDVLTESTKLRENLVCSGTALTIETDNITLDCSGNSVSGTGSGFGIHVNGADEVTVKNCYVDNFVSGIRLQSSSGSVVSRNVITGSTSSEWGAITLESSDGVDVSENTVKNNFGRGFLVKDDSDENRLWNNTAIGNGFPGFDITADPTSSDNNFFTVNMAFGNDSAGFVVSGGSSGNRFAGNEASDNESAGFAISSSGNHIWLNTAEDNGNLGYSDSTGPDNYYHANRCRGNDLGGSSPTGLCKEEWPSHEEVLEAYIAEINDLIEDGLMSNSKPAYRAKKAGEIALKLMKRGRSKLAQKYVDKFFRKQLMEMELRGQITIIPPHNNPYPKTPPGVPVPYPNTAMTKDTTTPSKP